MRKSVSSMSLLFLVLMTAAFGQSKEATAQQPSRYLYVWAGNAEHRPDHSATGMSMIAVFDANPASKSYGSLVNVLTVDSAGKMPHHTEFSPPSNATSFFANDFGADRSFLIDFSNPASPRLAGQTAKVPGARVMHSFA